MTRACALLLLMAGCSSAPRPPIEAPPRLEPTFLGLLLEAERGPVAIGFSPPRAEAAPYARADNACHMELEAYCAAACPGELNPKLVDEQQVD